ncbi:MAG: NADH-quinone oxidoreductase subunit C [Dehalococcoidia bacterium]|nr:NADH-quinone oxidoreductase subunit C [Dehalococcoidia bacterium]
MGSSGGATDPSSRGANATPAPAKRREPEAPRAAVALSPEGVALAERLPVAFASHGIEVDAALDEVVCMVPADHLVDLCRQLKDESAFGFEYLRLITVVDYVEQDGEFEVVYHLFSLANHHKMMVKTRIPDRRASVPSVTGVWRGADWYEREMHDLFGVVFEGHPDLSPLVLPDDFEGFPGRKSYPLHDYEEW